MNAKVEPIPEDRKGVVPYMVVAGCASAIEFYTKVFGAKVFGATETFRLEQPDGRIGHAELSIGGSVVYLCLCDEFPDYGTVGPLSVAVTPVSCMCTSRTSHSARSTKARPCCVRSRTSSTAIASRIEIVSPEEMRIRAEKLFGG